MTATYKPAKGDDVWVDFEGNEWPGVVEKLESSGYVRCRIQVDPEWDFGRGGERVMPEQTVAVRAGHVRARVAMGPFEKPTRDALPDSFWEYMAEQGNAC